MNKPRTEVIVATHGNPRALDLCLLALSVQRAPAFSVCVAEDGEDGSTAAVVADRARSFPAGTLRYVRQPHQGFRKNRVLNLAVASSAADYLIFVDGDCLAAPGFVERHLLARRPGIFLSGGVVRLGPSASQAVAQDDILSGQAFRLGWLRRFGHGGWRAALKAAVLPRPLATVLERVTPVAATWNGGHASAWRADLLSVNGFDESLGYGGEDIELGFRLNARGVPCRHVRYSATLLHLHHPRPYADAGRVEASVRAAWSRRRNPGTWTPHGIRSA